LEEVAGHLHHCTGAAAGPGRASSSARYLADGPRSTAGRLVSLELGVDQTDGPLSAENREGSG
jgi:hypothetical protein